jgi:hypothetical protein
VSQYISTRDLDSVSTSLLRSSLTATGWISSPVNGQPFQILESPDGETDIELPLHRNYRDYRARLNEAIIELEKYLGDRARAYMLQLLAGPTDEVQFVDESPTLYGSIRWSLGEDLYQTARESFRAAAKSTGQHLPSFGNKGAGLAKRFMDRVRMGQTEQGSYVIKALIPLNDEPDALPLGGQFDLAGSFYRRVNENLMQAVGVAVEAAEEYNRNESLGPFMDAVDYGVSAELVEALSQVAQHDETEIRATWSPLLADPSNTPNAVDVTPAHASAFVSVVPSLKKQSSVTQVTVTGTVTGLDRLRYGEAGISKLEVTSGINARRLRVRLSREQYDSAIAAHQEGNLLKVTGEVSRAGNIHWLYNVRNIEIIPSPPDLFSTPDARDI